MTIEETLNYLENCNKIDFINYAKQFNIFKTTKQPNYLIVRDKIIDLLSKHQLTENDVMPNPRVLNGDIQTIVIK